MRTAILLVLMTSAAWAGPIRLKVSVAGDKDTETLRKAQKKGGTAERVVTENRNLEISLSNSTTSPQQNLRVLYFVFAKDVKEKDFVLAKKGEKNVSVGSLATEKFATENVVMTMHPTYSKTKSGKTQGVPATGFKFAGYGVQVIAGNALIAEIFDPVELRAKTDLPETSTLYDEGKWKKGKKKD